jgi:hypothetical protein
MSNPFSKIGTAFKGGVISEVLAPGTGLATSAIIKSGQFIKNNAQKIQDTLNALKPQPSFRAANGPNARDEHIMTWRLPNGSSVQMYLNPQSLAIRESKQINTTRTKGGFVVQYWGANLTELTISGITGSSGIQGINVLRDIYYSENRAFDLVAATQTSEMVNELSSQELNSNNISDSMVDLAAKLRSRNFILRPSLAALATSVLMFYQGEEWKGFFTQFSVTETAERTGMFEYSLIFMATERHGKRGNSFAWQKEPLADDSAGLLLNGIGNAIRGMVGMKSQAPEQFGPANAPLTFGQSSLPSSLGFSSKEQNDMKTKLF